MTHALKTWTEFYKAVESGEKNFEIRKYDRPFKIGDTLLLQEWKVDIDVQQHPNRINGEYTSKEIKKRITYILKNAEQFGLATGFVLLGIKDVEDF